MRKVILFSGHMTDGPGRPVPRFPAGKETAARDALALCLAEWSVGPGDIAICGGARGGDILFAELCAGRGAALELWLPLDYPDFVAASLRLPPDLDARWQGRFDRLAARATVSGPPERVQPAATCFVENNRRMLRRARELARDRVLHVLLLWDGRGGDGEGGTADIAAQTRGIAAAQCVIDPGRL